MDIECHFQRAVIEGQVLQLNQDPIREVTISYCPQYEEKTPRAPSFAIGTQGQGPNPSREFFLYFYFILVTISTTKTHSFYYNP